MTVWGLVLAVHLVMGVAAPPPQPPDTTAVAVPQRPGAKLARAIARLRGQAGRATREAPREVKLLGGKLTARSP